MITHSLEQGSPAWLAHRRQFFNASDAPAMMGCSPYKTRDQLLHEMHTGLTAEVDAATQRRFDDGHRYEALARPHAAAIVGEELFPVTGSVGRYSASFDGLTMAEDTAFEHKTLNAELRACMRDEGNGWDLPKHYQVQMEQQLMVSGAERVLFTASKWEGDTLIEFKHCWYASDPKLRAQIVAGWEQFDKDLCAYEPVEKTVAPVGAAVTALPSIAVTVEGTIVVKDNFKAFEVALRDFIEHRLIRKPESDQDFADLDKQIKALKGAEAGLDAMEVQLLSQVAPIDAAKRTKDMLLAMARENRLMAEKLLAARKEQIKVEQVQRGVKALAEHVEALNTSLGGKYMPMVQADFGAAIKGLRTVDSLKNAIDSLLATTKISSSATANLIAINLNTFKERTADYQFLFADKAQLLLKANEDLQAIITTRVEAHERAEAEKLEKQRAAIREQERIKAEAEARDKLLAEQQAEDSLIASIWVNARRIEGDSSAYILKAKAAFETGAKDFEDDLRPRVAAAVKEAREEMVAKLKTATEREEAEAAKPAAVVVAAPAPAPATVDAGATRQVQQVISQATAAAPSAAPTYTPLTTAKATAGAPVAAPKPAGPPTLKLGEINARLAVVSVTAAQLSQLGFEPAAREKSAVLFHESQYPAICDAIVNSVQKSRELVTA